MNSYPQMQKIKMINGLLCSEAPEHWLSLSLKRLVSSKITDGPHETPEFISEGVPFVSAEAIENGTVNFTRIRGFISQEQHKIYSKKCLPQQNDIFIVKSGSTTGKIAYVDSKRDFNIWSPLALVRANSKYYNPRFLYYSLSSNLFQSQIQVSWSFGTQPNIGMGVLENLKVLLPSLEAQKKIADFLDQKTAAIATLIEKKQRLIQLLEEKRTALINQAVTKGLNTDAPTKDSGIPWIGDIPAHWHKFSIKRVCLSVRDGTHNPPPRVSTSGYRLLSARNIQNGRFILRDDDRLMSAEAFFELERSYTVRKDDVVIAVVGATTGKSALVEEIENISVQRSIAILRPESRIIVPEYLNFWVSSLSLQYEIELISSKYAAQGGIYLDELANLTCLIPPSIQEQAEIVDFLYENINPINEIEKRILKQINILQEYRQSLITAAVTGKIDVVEEDNAA